MSVPKFHSIELPRPRQHVIVEAWLKLHAGTVTLARIYAKPSEERLAAVLQYLLYDSFWEELYKRAEHQEQFDMPWHNPPHMHKPEPSHTFSINGQAEYTFSASALDCSLAAD